MAKKKQNIPAYGTAEINGVTYFRTRITDADGKRVPIYASTCEELYKKGTGRTAAGTGHPFSEAKPYRRRLL